MQIEWKVKANQSPYLFLQRAEWTGLCISRAKVLPGKLPEQFDDFHKINIAVAGSISTERISANGRHCVIKSHSGNLCVTAARQPVQAYWDEPLDNLLLRLEPGFLQNIALENRFSGNFEIIDSYQNEDLLIGNIGLALLTEAGAESPASRLYADSLIQTLALHFLKNYTTANFIEENRHGGLSGYKLRQVEEFISENLEKDLTLAEIAVVAGLSRFHFARTFRKTTGLTPQQYLMRKRVEKAKQLLAKRDLPIVEIGFRTGFKNQSHFTTFFRKVTKLTPKNWRESKLA